ITFRQSEPRHAGVEPTLRVIAEARADLDGIVSKMGRDEVGEPLDVVPGGADGFKDPRLKHSSAREWMGRRAKAAAEAS
ncbi:MAG: hypothetical protein ACJ76U_17475, partial [Gaiellaceae bacterium]